MTASFVGAMAVLVVLLGQLGRWFPEFDWVNALAPILLIANIVAVVIVGRRGHRAALLFVLAALMTGERIWPELQTLRAGPQAKVTSLRLLTFNAWHGLKSGALAASVITRSNADIVLLQEAGPLMRQERERLRKAYPYQSDCANARCEYVILSRFPMGPPEYRFRDDLNRPLGPGLLTARIALPDGSFVRVASLHLDRHALAANGHWGALDELAATIGQVADESLLLGGDFNLTPWSFAMQQLDEQMKPMRRMTHARWSYPAQLGGWRVPPVLPIDQLYAGPRWQLVDARTLPYAGSDHRALLIELSDHGPSGR